MTMGIPAASPPSPGGSAPTSSNTPKMEAEVIRSETGIRTIGRFKLRGKTDDLPQSWWYASTAIPLIAATIGPLANVLSIAAIVSKWRSQLDNDGSLPEGADALGTDIDDPKWEIVLNAISLACGCTGNFFLLLNFTKRVRYIIALPVTIIFWFLATGILVGIIIAVHIYIPPIPPGQTYGQGYWHAVLASILYMIGSFILMVNMLGYVLGKYPQHFDLDDDQRTLILQTMMFFFWLAGGAAVFQAVADFSYADSLYFCQTTILTVGFGDLTSPNDLGRGLIIPYSVIGIIFLGLMVTSLRRFMIGISKDKLFKAREQNEREKTLGRTVTTEKELRDRLGLPPRQSGEISRNSDTSRNPSISNPGRKDSLSRFGRLEVIGRTVTFHEYNTPAQAGNRGGFGKVSSRDQTILSRRGSGNRQPRRADRRKKLLLLREEKDRFDAMRQIQADTKRFRQYYNLSLSILAFGLLWCLGALVFMYAEQREQDLTYFQALYFTWVSLLTIGYGDFSPRSNAGKPFFIVWAIMAVPTMTILISDMSDTVVSAINRGTFTLADWTVMPKKGLWHKILKSFPQLLDWLQRIQIRKEQEKRIHDGFQVANPDLEGGVPASGPLPSSLALPKPRLEDLAAPLSDHQLARNLTLAIRRVAQDMHSEHAELKKYSYEEWVEFTRLIRFSRRTAEEVEKYEEEDGLVEWDWIGEDSPMLSDIGEPQWVLDRLCESLNRYTRRQARVLPEHHKESDLRRRRKHHPTKANSASDESSDKADGEADDEAENEVEDDDQKSIRGTPNAPHLKWAREEATEPAPSGRLHGPTEDEDVQAWDDGLRRQMTDEEKLSKQWHGKKEKGL